MAEPYRLPDIPDERLKRIQEAAADRAAAVDRAPDGGDSGGMPPDLDKRVEKLENKVDRIGLDVAEIKGKVSQLPTVWHVVVLNFSLAIAIAGLVFVVARSMK
jgi:hypothetical protein